MKLYFTVILLLALTLVSVQSRVLEQTDFLVDMEDEAGRYLFLKELNALPDHKIKEICANMEKSLFSPFRCLNNTDPAQSFLKEASVEAFAKQLMAKSKQVRDSSASSSSSSSTQLKPLILIPGIAGSGLEAKIQKTSSPAWFCWKNSSWFRLWLALSEIVVQDCWFDNLELTYDPTNNTYSNAPGVQVRPIDFGGMKGVAYLDYIVGFPITLTDCFGSLIKFFTALGLEEGKTIRGAPYDFRLPIESMAQQGWFDQLQALVEETYANAGNQRVNILSHSMGGMVGLYFLNTMTYEWKEKYIEAFIPIAVPWSGAPKVFRALISGDNFGIPLVSLKRMKEFAQSAGGVVQLLPDPLIWNTDQVFVQTPTQNYSISNINDLFENLGLNYMGNIYSSVISVIYGQIPNVTTHCIYGYGTPTEMFYNYPEGLFSGEPEITSSSLGDGTVPLESLKYCTVFQDSQKQLVTIQEFQMLEHVGIVQDQDVFQYLYSIFTSQNN